MQLNKIKIAGFKTFVDPTTIALPSNLVAIVGPNGCGKSNIIDAVTWVMGESSPKYLRGEALTDVIFNGSGSRKPVGQASVELIFDNSSGGISGEYGKFTEISIKRMINRDSDSSYYLNGVRCRKRDVVDIFLGTGLGPRSYSIIGQNMINKIIEAKPEELRTYLEEAAGISKYKERRHETELRMQHTKENLARVNDLLSELEKQLSHLKYQANMAEKYKDLKQQERRLRAECLTVSWRELDSLMVDATLNIQREETALEARMSEISTTNREIEELHHEKRSANDVFQELQRKYYATGNEITRIEQDILHHQEKEQQWQQDLAQIEHDYEAIQDQITENEQALKELQYEVEQNSPAYNALEDEVIRLEESLSVNEDEMQHWQSRWDDFNQKTAKTKQRAQVEKTHIQHLEERITMLRKRNEQIQEDLADINVEGLDDEILAFNEKSSAIAAELTTYDESLAALKQNLNQLTKDESEAKVELDHLRSELQQLRGQQASLLALQETALGQRDNPTLPWISEHQLDKNSRLAQHVEVDAGWEFAVEKVLGFNLQAICVDDKEKFLGDLADFTSGNLCLFNNQSTQAATTKSAISNTTAMPLLAKIRSPLSLTSLLTGIYTAETIEEGLAIVTQIAEHESVITKDGVWLNRAWIRILREKDPSAGIFHRESALKEIATKIADYDVKQQAVLTAIQNIRQQIVTFEKKRDEAQQIYNNQQARSVELSTQHKLKQERLNELQTQYKRLKHDQAECEVALQHAVAELTQAQQLFTEAEVSLKNDDGERDAIIKERDKIKNILQEIRERTNDKKDALHELEIRQETMKSQKTSVSHNIIQLKKQLKTLEDRRGQLQVELASLQSFNVLKDTLNQTLDKHVAIENELNNARSSVELLEQEFRNLEQKRQVFEQEVSKIRARLEGLRVESQGWKVKAETILQQLKETEFTLELLKDLPQDLDPQEWQKKHEQVQQRINRLGAINLVAIEEYSTCLERKEYLDKQLQDLQTGLQTLEEAIAKIDRETKSRFKETFDRVNERFQELFPTVFGGGKAYLELTEDNLLSAGVGVMAMPPGKRNSSIYLLSGGEKTLTAIALIFSIFHLNPAPFCLLDEVDAALDDANVLRFTHLVKSMAEQIQFIYISHNKITIEMAEHLIGVTMNEPGVSRLVTVDIEKAMSLAGVDKASAES